MAKSHVDGLLHTVPLFSHCTKKELTQLSGLTTTVVLPAGKVVVSQGQTVREFATLLMDVPDVTRGILNGVAARLCAADASLAQ
jgi:hypothetical protein